MTDQIIASRYRVIRELGRGGMGVVYLVEHTRTGDHVALKLLYGQSARDEQTIERFKREARAAARIKSEHIVKVIDADTAPELEGAPFLVMELLNGKDLEHEIETKGRMPPDQAIHYLAQAARALDKSHQMGIVHRDLKPENLFIHHREDGSTVLKILDFGISKFIATEGSGDIGGAKMTSTGAVMGTPYYMSPEQARGRVSEIGPTTDVWAMGLIALQLLSGEIYWRAATVAELMSQILAEPFYPPSQRWPWLTPAVDAWFARSCARDPKGRFATVGEQIQALGAALRVGASPGPPSEVAGLDATMAAPPPAPSGRIPGVRTTTGAIAREPTESRPGRAAWAVGGALLLLGGVGATAWSVGARRTAATVVTEPSTVVAMPSAVAASVAPPVASPAASVASPALAVVPSASPPAAAAATPDAGTPLHAAGHAHRPPPAPRPVTAAAPPPASPPPAPASPAGVLNPTAP